MNEWWKLEAAADLTIAVAYLCIAVLVAATLARLHQPGNQRAVATAAIFLSGSAGYLVLFVMPFLHGAAGPAAAHVSTWWTASTHVVTACIALYYLSLRRFYGRLLESAPVSIDPAGHQRRSELEAFRTANAARAEAEDERDFAVALMSSITRHSPALIYVKDLDGRYLMVNQAYERTVGVRRPTWSARRETPSPLRSAPRSAAWTRRPTSAPCTRRRRA